MADISRNKTAAIQEIVEQEYWFHIAGKLNPSDIISRPVTPKQLVENKEWFSGPSWGLLPREQWPVKRFGREQISTNVPEGKTSALLIPVTTEIHPIYKIAERVSRWESLLGTTVFVLRFIKKLTTSGPHSIADLTAAEIYIIKSVQETHFSKEVKLIKEGKQCQTTIKKLHPFLDGDIIRVGGRLSNADIEYEHRHPALLPAKDVVTQLMIEYHHRRNLHTGPGLLLSIVRQHYWVLGARSCVRRIVHACNTCFKNRPREASPMMGDLPRFRVQQIKPFEKCGVDYAGPIIVTSARGRGGKRTKAYICLFVCLATKALHVELASDLSTDKFLAAYKRFIARRGPIRLLLSDGGKNFIGAHRKLNEIYDLVTSVEFNREIIKELTPRRVEFKVNPPYAPHFGGIWESNIKNVKTHLYRVVGSQVLTYEELNTFLVQIEALLNSRPLCILSDSPADPAALTPAHFLSLTPLDYTPADDLSDVSINQVQRYALVDKLIQSYWRRWHAEYLSCLQTREKWNTTISPIKVGQVVIIKEPNLPTLCWPLGVVEGLHPGKDGVTRVVRVKTKNGSYLRSANRLCPLPTQ